METGKHAIVAIIFLAFLAFILSVAIFIWQNSKSEGDGKEIKKKVYRIRARYFIVLMVTLLVLSIITLSMLPYPTARDKKADVTISVVAGQWYWKMKKGTLKKNGLDMKPQYDLVIPANKVINFQVTSLDVNHGFGIYNKKGQLIDQTQAMPGYVNNLKITFTQPGEYHIVCLEYCGMAHQAMVGQIVVK